MNVINWAMKAQVGESIVYSRKRGRDDSDKKAMETARKAHDLGLVFLAQRRCGLGCFDLEAVCISRETAKRLDILPRNQYRKGER